MPICAECGKEHPPEDLELTFRRPDIVAALEPDERSARVQENKDLCVLDGERFFVRALLPLPVLERDHPYNVGVWVEVSREAFDRVYELWNEESQADEPAFRAVLANDIGLYPTTNGLLASLSLTGPTTRPVLTLGPTEHPLVGEQIRGITAHRAAQYFSMHAAGAA